MSFSIEKYQSRPVHLLEDLPREESLLLKKHIQRIEKQKGKVLFREGSYPKGAYVLLRGKVKVYQTNEAGKEQIVCVYRKGALFGHNSLITGEPSVVSVALLENCVFSFIPTPVFLRAMEEAPSFSKKLLLNFSNQYRVLVNKISLFAQRTVRERVAIALMLLNEKYRKGNKKNGRSVIDLSRDDLANYAGTTVETLVRMLRSFKDEKIIRTKGRKITILSPERLGNIYGVN